MAAAVAAAEKVFVALPAEFKAGQSTLSWVLSHFGGGGSTIVIAHVYVPSQMIPVMGGKFHASQVCPDQVALFRWVEREKVNKMLNEYVHQCSKLKVKCEKLIFEKEDVAAGLIDLIAFHGVTKLVISAAADRQYSRKMDKPKSRTAIEIMQRADPSCKIWFVCKGQLICTRDKEAGIARAGSPLIPDLDRHSLQLSPQQEEEYAQEEGDLVLELGLYAEIEEASMAAESLMRRALDESSRRRKADEELVSALQKAKEYEELYLEEARKREELEAALARANREIARLKETNNLPTAEPELQEEEMTEASSVERWHVVDDMSGDTGLELLLGTSGQAVIEPEAEEEYVQVRIGSRGDNGASEMRALLLHHRSTSSSSKQVAPAFSPSSVIQSPYDDEEDDCAPSYLLCPILKEVTRDPHVAADGLNYEAGAILGAGRKASPVTDQPLALAPNPALRGAIQDYVMRRRQHRF